MMARLLVLLLCPFAALAAAPPDLPPAAQVERALHAHPLVRAADAGVEVEAANRDRLAAGPHEFALRLASQQRRDRSLDHSYREHEIGVERALRLPGKAATDAALGAAGIEQARLARGDALHESARLLLGRWYEWQREAAAAREWVAQVATLQRQHEVVGKRVGAGDAAKLEELLSGAQLAQARAQLEQVEGKVERAAMELTQAFPDIALPAAVVASEPQPIAGSPETWRERILAHNHELAVARVASRRAHLAAQRADAERLPDPTLGVKFASDRDGQERVFGLQLSIPLPGAARAASARAGQSEAAAAGAREALVLARVEAEARRTVSLAQGAHRHWQRLNDVAARMADNDRLLEKAWRLGEGQFTELQTARRQAIEARLAAVQAQLEANEARYRLLLDAHELWPLNGDAAERH
ncbi:MAG: TolC family protein [Gammaproteobacteria bacterium]|nr:TolC family protein [Rhodocyclaceae bacterium]MBU3910088.1 TolC family protein [Gammaproteobacteria bacterium]MBU3989429.1 TolC family protein [Gammaproteobacteria bacterium]MBU4003915.1 TolC family protein [Gammaproteobacteria bacterium]MBU4022550.1 TolC family protein [Gammaproteobacteria bacterium]